MRQFKLSTTMLLVLCLGLLAWAVWATLALWQKNIALAAAISSRNAALRRAAHSSTNGHPAFSTQDQAFHELYRWLTDADLSPSDTAQLLNLARRLVRELDASPASAAQAAALLNIALESPDSASPEVQRILHRVLQQLRPDQMLLLKEMAGDYPAPAPQGSSEEQADGRQSPLP